MKITAAVEININEVVTVKLTPAGQTHLLEFYEDLKLPRDMTPAVPDGILRIQLWELMHIFGPQMYMGNKQTMFE